MTILPHSEIRNCKYFSTTTVRMKGLRQSIHFRQTADLLNVIDNSSDPLRPAHAATFAWSCSRQNTRRASCKRPPRLNGISITLYITSLLPHAIFENINRRRKELLSWKTPWLKAKYSVDTGYTRRYMQIYSLFRRLTINKLVPIKINDNSKINLT